MDKELNVARVLKQLVYILEDNDFVLYYDKRFESLKPQIDDEHDYLHHESYDGPYSPMTYLRFRDSESKVDYHLDYRDVFTHTLHYSKYLYPMPQNPFSHKMETYLDPYKTYSETEAKELAEEIFNELVSKNNQDFAPNDTRPTKYREFITLTKEPRTRENLAERIHKELEPHYGTVFLDEPFYPSVEPLDETKCTISITPDLQIKVSVTSEEYPRREHTIRHGVHIQYCEYDEDTQELVEYVGVKYSTDKTIESPLVLHATIQELLDRIELVKTRKETQMTLFEIYYHDPWRTRSTYARQYITTSADDVAQWLLEHLDEWYGDDDQEIDDVIEQGLEQTFNYINNQFTNVGSLLNSFIEN